MLIQYFKVVEINLSFTVTFTIFMIQVELLLDWSMTQITDLSNLVFNECKCTA